MEDTRLDWMKSVTYKFLNISEDDEAFNNLLERDHLCSRNLYTLFSGKADSIRCVFFYDTYEEEEVELENVEEENDEQVTGSSKETIASAKRDEEEGMSDSGVSDFDKNDKEDADIFDKDIESDEVKDDEELSLEEHTHAESDEKPPDDNEPEIKSKSSLRQIQQKVVLHFCLNILEHVPKQKYVYFLLHKIEPVPLLDTYEESLQTLPKHFKFGLINKHPLIHLEEVSSLAYFPLFSEENVLIHVSPEVENMTDLELKEAFFEFEKRTNEFYHATKEVVAQIEKPFMIRLPHMSLDFSIQELEEDPAFIAEAEDLAADWNMMTRISLEKITEQVIPDQCLLEEIEFWKRRKSDVSTCCDQMSNSLVQKTIQVLQRKGLPQAKEFCELEVKIQNELKTATENVNYLICMEPNVRILLSNTPKVIAIRALDALLCMLEVIWVQSDYYKYISNMQRLLKGITNLLKRKIMKNNSVKRLFGKDLHEIQQITSESAEILHYWKESYLKECEVVKQYGGLYRWGFDIKTFFDETDHLIVVCHNLQKVAQVTEELHNVFKTSLRHLVQDTKGLYLLETRVLGITARIQYSDFDVFDPVYHLAWDKTVSAFQQEVTDLEEEIKNYIAKTLRSGLSWENTSLLARSFNRVKVSKTILDFINKSHDDMLNQYIKEIISIENEFLSGKDEPPQFELIPNHASAIVWNHDMMIKLITPMSEISKIKTESKKEAEVHQRFEKTKAALSAYKLEVYELWKTEANENLNKFLQAKLLKKDFNVKGTERAIGSSANVALAKLQEAMSYKVHFPIYLEEVSIQAKLLEYFKFDIPVLIRNTILRENIYYGLRIQITVILEKLQSKLADLTPSQSSLMSDHIETICNVLDLGISYYQWDSSEVPDFIVKMKQATDILICLLTQIQNISKEIDVIIQSIATCDIIYFCQHNSVDLPTCEVYFDDAEREMNEKVSRVVALYYSILPYLHKLEMVTCQTRTGRAPQLKFYYRHCEEEILKSLIKMILLNLEYFKSEVMEHFIFPYIQAAFQFNDELVMASTKRIKLVFLIFVENIIKSTQRFVRWLNGTCIESPSFHLHKTNEKTEFSYFLDLSLHPNIKTFVLSIIQKLFAYIDNMKG